MQCIVNNGHAMLPLVMAKVIAAPTCGIMRTLGCLAQR
jgi:hypothetical protein